MPFTAQEMSSMAAAALDFYVKGKPMAQTLQDRPFLKSMMGVKKSFGGGAGLIRRNVKGEYTSGFTGFEGDDQVFFRNPANIRQINYPWKEIHGGMQVTLTELKRDGISVVDSLTGKSTTTHTDAEVTRISSIFDDKMDDMTEGLSRSMNNIMLLDGTQDSKVPPGLLAFVTDAPTTGVIAGIDRASTTWWRNRARTAASVGGAIASSAANQTLTTTLRAEVRQLKRYGGRPNLLICGSGFLEKLEAEVFAKGTYSQTGFTNKGSTEIGMADIEMRGVGSFIYEPSLDDMGRTNYCYILDTKHLYPMVMDGEDMKKHFPARPHDQFVVYQGVTWTGALIADQMNCHGVYSIT